MINAWHLIWIIPLSVISGGIAGAFIMALCAVAGRADRKKTEDISKAPPDGGAFSWEGESK